MEMVYLDFFSFWFYMEWGNEYILMLVDSFIKWVECVLLFIKIVNVIIRVVINILFF